jgi:hypothetical protein
VVQTSRVKTVAVAKCVHDNAMSSHDRAGGAKRPASPPRMKVSYKRSASAKALPKLALAVLGVHTAVLPGPQVWLQRRINGYIVELREGKTVLGRGAVTGIDDPRCSQRQGIAGEPCTYWSIGTLLTVCCGGAQRSFTWTRRKGQST